MSRLERLLEEIESTKRDADGYKKQMKQYAKEGNAWAYSLALEGYRLSMKYHRDAVDFYTKIAAWSGDSQTA